MKKLFTGKQAIALLLCLTLLSVIFLTGCDNSTPAPSENPTPPTVAVESVSLNQTALTMAIGDIVTLVATVLPSDATDRTVTYSSSNPAVAIVTDGTVTAVGTGTAVIIAATANGKTATCTVTVETPTTPAAGVTLDKANLTLTVGDTGVLTATVLPDGATDKTVTWTSSDPTVASVENGVVTAVSTGTAVIIAATANGKTATCTVTVETPTTPAAGVTLDKANLTLTVGDTGVLTASVLPANATDKTLTWISSDPTVATVSGGVVSAIGAGTAIVTVTTPNGKTATCTVTVALPTVEVTGVTVNKTELSMTVGDTGVLTASLLPANATDKTLTWISSDPTVATVSGGVVSAVGAGTAIVTVTTANGKTATCTVTVALPTVEVSGVTVNKTELSMTVGDRVTLTASFLPANATDKTLTWISSDPTVATVSGGVVSAVGAGTAIVTVTTANGKTSICTVTVKEKTIPSGLNFALTSDDSFYIVTGYYGNATEYTIPAIYDGLRVIGIQSNAFRNNTNLKKIIIPGNIETIGTYAFAGCTALTDIVLPESVTQIADSTFAGCTALKSIRIHGKIRSVGENAFSGCVALTNLTLENGVTEIGAFAFDGCTALVSVELPDSVTLVGNGAFRHAQSLGTVKLSGNMTAINNITFQYCESLRSVSLHSGITEIGNSAFSFCYGLENLEILGNLTKIGNSAFYHCEKLKNIFYASRTAGDFGKTHYTFCRAGLGGDGIRLTLAAGAVVPEGLFEPFEEANRPKITEIVFEDGTGQVTSFAKYSNFTYLKKITIPYSVTSVPSGMLKGCTGLTVVMEDEHYTFLCWYDNSALEGDAVDPTNYAGEAEALYPLWGGKNQSVEIVRNIGSAGTVSGSGNHPYGAQVTLTATTNPGYTFLGWFDGETLLSEEVGYTFAVTSDRVLTAKWKANTYPVKVDKNISGAGSVSGAGTYDFGSSVTVTAQTNTGYTFLGWYNGDVLLSESETYTFIMPEGLTLTAKWRKNFYSVATGKNISGAGSVSGAGTYPYHAEVTVKAETNITYVFLGWYENGTLLTTLPEYTFTMEMSDRDLEARWKENEQFTFKVSGTSCILTGVKDKTATEYIIPDYVTAIGASAFEGCSNLTRITIPKGVTSIGYAAFDACRRLESITVDENNTVYHSSGKCLIETESKTLLLGCKNSEIPADGSVTSIGYAAFNGCFGLKSITIPDGITSIGNAAFV